jgi:chemotaxis protein MotB
MAKQPWEQSDPDLSALGLGSRRNAGRWSRILLGLLVIAGATFVLAYYLPLYRAHQTLTKEHVMAAEKAKALEESLTKTREQLDLVTKRRDELETARSAREGAEKSLDQRIDTLRATLESSLGKYKQGNAVQVASSSSAVHVALSNAFVLNGSGLDVSARARSVLCEIPKTDLSSPIRVHVVGPEDESIPAALQGTPSDIWSLHAVRAANVARALQGHCSVERGRLTALANSGATSKDVFDSPPAARIELELVLGELAGSEKSAGEQK